ncbi:MAG TPA: helix-hairpin-helix domain-containing protein [Candidatus Angelobacter sp.]|nr:helix-hairpin-helix domain-containing protein [Candidatus Angelobacter sp.]
MSLSRGNFARTKARRLQDLISVGPAMLRDFEMLGISNMAQLARANPQAMYKKLCRITGQQHDICCQDVFSAAVAQARDPLLPVEQCVWWYWSRKRKAQRASA